MFNSRPSKKGAIVLGHVERLEGQQFRLQRADQRGLDLVADAGHGNADGRDTGREEAPVRGGGHGWGMGDMY